MASCSTPDQPATTPKPQTVIDTASLHGFTHVHYQLSNFPLRGAESSADTLKWSSYTADMHSNLDLVGCSFRIRPDSLLIDTFAFAHSYYALEHGEQFAFSGTNLMLARKSADSLVFSASGTALKAMLSTFSSNWAIRNAPSTSIDQGAYTLAQIDWTKNPSIEVTLTR